MSFKRIKTAATLVGLAVAGTLPAIPAYAAGGTGSVVLIQTGDIHGHLVPRANLRSDAIGQSNEGGVARMYTKIQQIRASAIDENGVDHSLLINTGDTVQGSGEALFSRGQVMIDVLNNFGYVAHAPGNWDFLYGRPRFEETFKGVNGNPPLANWGALAANLYDTYAPDANAECAGKDPVTGVTMNYKRVLPPYIIKDVGGVKVGILGMTTARAIAAVGPTVTDHYTFTDAKPEVACYVNKLRTVEKVDLVVMISELEMARDIQIAETVVPAPDVILNSDMHERTTAPIQAVNPSVPDHITYIVEEGQDGTVVGQMKVMLKKGVITDVNFKQHIMNDSVAEDPVIAAKVAEVRAPYLGTCTACGSTVTVGGNITRLNRPVDEVIATTLVGLHRSNFMDEDMPGVVEGTSHDLIADAMKVIGGAQASSIRGFRYGTHVPAGGNITMEDIYHYIPIAAKLGRTEKACGADLKFAIENSIGATFHSDPVQWGGGWMFGYSGLNYTVDACSGFTGVTPVNPVQLAFGLLNNGKVTPFTFYDQNDPKRYRAWTTARGTTIMVGDKLNDDLDIYDNRAFIVDSTGAPILDGNGQKQPNPTFQKCLAGDGANTPHGGYSVTGYWFNDAPNTINNCGPCVGRQIQAVMNEKDPATGKHIIKLVNGPGFTGPLPNSADVLDMTEAVVEYLRAPAIEGGLGGVVTAENLPIHRLTVKRLPLNNPYSFKVVQPLKGSTAATCPALP